MFNSFEPSRRRTGRRREVERVGERWVERNGERERDRHGWGWRGGERLIEMQERERGGERKQRWKER